MPFRHVNPDQSGNSEQSDSSPGPDSVSASHTAPATPGYFPRLLSAAAHVTHVASDGALERFGLNRNSFTLLTLLAAAATGDAVKDTALAAGTRQPLPAVRRELSSLVSSGYAEQRGCVQEDPETAGGTDPAVLSWAVTEAGREAIKCAQLAEAEVTLDAEDSQELRRALRSLIASLGLEHPDN
ncbi:hypothetical protein LJ753_06240 [Arthrobacter sp. zg-Y20]|uniref:hypothetical protein n=1 Tax=unclassified Arthrobacter TaxID=235627 RepID=UPI001D14D12D|nr:MULTISPECIES: hypothetical protein [unclassified Arthrobacter]MCC3275469.1 hypothetical protein [Arthrobacter sp. zg-Y20]MDK1315626.1 hypothetical protein [Arthrobacter sp. zg.Y20]WIB06040.1 hypothetical protein QNO06_16215 [Arthrobacter sp. zg-Y20]